MHRLTSILPRRQLEAEIPFIRQHLPWDAQLKMEMATVAAECKRLYDEKHRQLQFNARDRIWLKTGKASQPLPFVDRVS